MAIPVRHHVPLVKPSLSAGSKRTLYDLHVPQIAKGMRSSLTVFKRGILFAICSIRQQVIGVPDQMDAITSGDLSPLFGHKVDAYAYLEEHAETLFRNVKDASLYDAMWHLTRIPGLGLIKAAFVCQLMGHDIACLDSRNARRAGVTGRPWRTDGQKSGNAFLKRLRAYIRAFSGLARSLWNEWCREVAKAYGLTPLAVSELHLAVVRLDIRDTF